MLRHLHYAKGPLYVVPYTSVKRQHFDITSCHEAASSFFNTRDKYFVAMVAF